MAKTFAGLAQEARESREKLRKLYPEFTKGTVDDITFVPSPLDGGGWAARKYGFGRDERNDKAEVGCGKA